MRIAVIGTGISGIAAAGVLKRCGHEIDLFEKSNMIGGIWAMTYPGTTLQNSRKHYHVSDIPWPFEPKLHPTAEQVMRYMHHCIKVSGLSVELNTRVKSMQLLDSGWRLTIARAGNSEQRDYDFVLVASGQYSGEKERPEFSGEASFKGRILTDRDVESLEVFRDKKVVAVGFGKSAVDMAMFAAAEGAEVHHVFRTPRWLIPMYLGGMHYSRVLMSRFGSVMMPAWAHPDGTERALHKYLPFVINGFWSSIRAALKQYIRWHGRGSEARTRLDTVTPSHAVTLDLRSAAALEQPGYYRRVADGSINPHHATFEGFDKDGVVLGNGERIDCDVALLSLGSEMPAFPFLPDEYRPYVEGEPDGAQLYRHVLHPRIPRLAFTGFNHGFMHIPSAEVGALWLDALLHNRVELPSVEEMERSIEAVREWKREHIAFEPSRSCAVNTRFQQYMDGMLRELGVTPYRKMPNVFAECFQDYGAADYDGMTEEYLAIRNADAPLSERLALDF